MLLLLVVIITQGEAVKCTSNKSKVEISCMKTQCHKRCSNASICPTWFICDHYNERQCGDAHNDAIICDEKKFTSAVLDCHCVTYDGDTNTTFLGACFYNCENFNTIRVTERDKVYHKLPATPEMLINQSACTRFHRKGLLCGDCEDGHSPLVLSYNLSCVECPDGHKNWWKFILVAFVPLTFFYFFVVFFNINVTSSRLHGVVWFSQALSTPAFIRLILSRTSKGNSQLGTSSKIIITLYSYWNLDLLRSVLPNTCLDVTTLQALALDYLLALCPYVLILLSYFLISLYDRKVSCIVRAWNPFHKLLFCFRTSWDVRTSVIDSFATFFLLSYFKILNVSTDLLVPTRIYQLGSNRSTHGLYYSPSVTYFGREHLPYAITAVFLLTVFVITPTVLLILYPFQFFQKCLSVFPFNWHFLRAFVDSFQGCYKDGTEPGTFDCRWFSTTMLLIHPTLFITFSLTLSMMFFVYSTIIIVILLIAMINIQPFKEVADHYDVVFHLLFRLGYISLIGLNNANSENNEYTMVLLIITILSATVPIVYITLLICFWLISMTKWIRSYIIH